MKSIFFREYVKNIRTVGAVLPSSRFLARKIVEEIDFASAKTIVQFGPGTGSFTKEIIARRHPATRLLLIEKNAAFCKQLQRDFGEYGNVIIVHDSAENIGQLLKQHGLPAQIDYIVSGLPFASLPGAVSRAILDAAKHHTRRGYFITFQYTLLKKPLLQQYFSNIAVSRELKNIPPAYVLFAHN